jgi:hypothetical protein
LLKYNYNGEVTTAKVCGKLLLNNVEETKKNEINAPKLWPKKYTLSRSYHGVTTTTENYGWKNMTPITTKE